MTTFEGTISIGELRSVVDSVTVLVEDCRVFFKNERVVVRGTDPAGVGLVMIEISEAAFTDAVLNEADVCWDFTEMADMIGTGSKDDNVTLEVKNHELNIDFLDLSFTLSLIDPSRLDLDRQKPELDLPAEVVLDSDSFQRGVDAAGLVADHVELGINDRNSAFYMEAKGDVNEVILEKEKQDLVTLATEPVSSTYSVDYLKDICRAVPDSTNVSINLGEDYPTEISFKIVDNQATVTYFLSPRIHPES